MKYISHRINTIEKLIQTPVEYGVEIDLRDYNEKLVLAHDPFVGGEEFEDFLKYYNHGIMILNIKSERIEYRVLDLLKKFNVTNYFFLDSSFPMVYSLSNDGENNIALRYSEVEALDSIMIMKNKVKWVWVDCFTKFPLDLASYNILNSHFNLCLVSPELQGHPLSFIGDFAKKIADMPFQAICTKRIDLWQKSLKIYE